MCGPQESALPTLTAVTRGASAPGPRRLLSSSWRGLVVAASTAAAISVYDSVTGRFGAQRFDGPALKLGKRLRSPTAKTAAGAIAYGFGPIGMPLLTLATGAALALRARKATPLAFVTSAGGGSLAMTVQMARATGRALSYGRTAGKLLRRLTSIPVSVSSETDQIADGRNHASRSGERYPQPVRYEPYNDAGCNQSQPKDSNYSFHG